VPGWYIIAKSDGFDGTDVFSQQRMLDEESVPTFMTAGIAVTGYRYDQLGGQLIITYKGSTDMTGQVSLKISGFRNPVNQRPKSGFGISTMDENGFLINFS
jgi:hypothetical protein